MTIQGKIEQYQPEERTIVIKDKHKKRTMYFQRALFNKFQKFLMNGFFIVLDYKTIERKNGEKRDTVVAVKRIVKPSWRGPKTLFSDRKLKDQTKAFINSLKTKLFLDFEMSMHPYKVDKHFVQEIIQIGYVLEDEDGRVLKTFKTCVQPTKHKTLTKRTLKFLDLTQKDVNNGMDYPTFYRHLNDLINTHHPAIVVWGKNDYLSLKESYQVNNVKSLSGRTRFVNLLKLHKNYFNFKNDLGLKNAYEMYGHEKENQRHDALEDAQMTRAVFNGFKAYINNPESTPLSLKK